MEDPVQRAPSSVSSFSGTECLAIVLLFLLAIMMAAWPTCCISARAGFAALTRPFLRINDPTSKPVPSNLSKGVKSPADRAARLARSMEFRIQQYSIHPAMIKTWGTEWNLQPVDNLLLLRPLLNQLPGFSPRETPVAQQNDLIQTIFQTSADIRTIQPNNPIPSLAESLALFYTGQDLPSLNALRQSQIAGRISLGLPELNRSEYEVWRLEAHPYALFPLTPRTWDLGMEKTLHLYSRGLAVQERALLQKYNIERALDMAFLHLGLAGQIRDMGWGPADFAIARNITHRAMLPFWSQRGAEPTIPQLSENFIHFLEDQGDKLAPAKVRAILGDFDRQQAAIEKNLTTWRKIQLIGSWNASSVLSCLFLQTISLFLVWATITFSLSGSPYSPSDAPGTLLRFGLSGIPFALPPIIWTFSGWPPGGTYLLAGLLGAWLLWGILLKYHQEAISLSEIRTVLAQGLVTMTLLTLLTIAGIAIIFQFRMNHLRAFLEHGWLI